MSDQRHREHDELQAELARAAVAFDPHRATLTAAARTSRQARDTVAHAKRRLDNSRPPNRRSARNELIDAEQAHAAATDDLNGLLRTAGPLRDGYVDALTRHEAAHRVMVPAGILDSWTHYPARIDQLEQLLDSLDTWRRWALGHDVSADRLSESAAVIDRFAAKWRGEELVEIVAAVDGWSRQVGLDLSATASGAARLSPGFGRGVGLER